MSEHVLPNILEDNFKEANLVKLPNKFYKSAKQYLNKEDLKKIQKAYSVAFYAHDGQDRMDGSKYITHPEAVANILLDLKMDPDSICAALMHDVIEEYEGQIINYIGDSVMVVFGAPKKVENHEIISVKCAIKMREKLEELNTKWDENEFSRYWKNHGINQITARTGIHTGGVIAGNIGSNRMLQYSTIGDSVNVASRLEQSNKDFSTTILFSHEIYSSLTKELYDKANYQGEISLKGRDQKTKVYDI